eukprot:c28704_g1_i1.p1 GENE.c28704_g1_i1~~c28704_g1_i1.p1  ORF type:complete len:141 (+),score=13.48 c28704_g1_i1:36-458(+)
MSFTVTIEDDLLDHIGTVMSRGERRYAQTERDRYLTDMQKRAYFEGFQKAQAQERAVQAEKVDDIIRPKIEAAQQHGEKIFEKVHHSLFPASERPQLCQFDRSAALSCLTSAQQPLECTGPVRSYLKCAQTVAQDRLSQS